VKHERMLSCEFDQEGVKHERMLSCEFYHLSTKNQLVCFKVEFTHVTLGLFCRIREHVKLNQQTKLKKIGLVTPELYSGMSNASSVPTNYRYIKIFRSYIFCECRYTHRCREDSGVWSLEFGVEMQFHIHKTVVWSFKSMHSCKC
jgi:hypothetical protein